MACHSGDHSNVGRDDGFCGQASAATFPPQTRAALGADHEDHWRSCNAARLYPIVSAVVVAVERLMLNHRA